MKASTASKNKKALPKKEITKNNFPIVAIGASAGGLEAVTQLLQNLPADTGMSFIYFQHLNPDYKSVLAEILSKTAQMKVLEAENKMRIFPNIFYVIPPGKEMLVLQGHIILTPRKKDHLAFMSIDAFFSSLAKQHNERVIGIVLSGSNTDGTLGLKAIKQEGGFTFAQDDSAKFKSMPKSAAESGAADFILSPKEIARKLVNFSKHGYIKHGIVGKGVEDNIENENIDLKHIIRLLYTGVGVDFTHYKMNTIKRRIIRRMLLNKKKSLKGYAVFLSKNSDELNLLYQDLLINVTNFFRDKGAHLFLKTSILPLLLKSKVPGETLRVWVAACATGEEAYSMAMTILEILGNKSSNRSVQIFATDLSEQAVSIARIGEYSAQELEAVSPERLQRFFNKSEGGYRIIKSVREMCVFAPHNVLSDPPFSRVDFISCRNLLIYLEAAAQKKVISMFHYALNEGGYLMLGEAETIGSCGNLFAQVNKKFKIFLRKKNTGIRTIPLAPSGLRHPHNTLFNKVPQKHLITPAVDIDKAIDSIILSHYVPASVIINYDMEIIQFRGATSLYLQHAPGKASLNILKLIRPEIAFELRTAIHNAVKTKKTIHKSGIEFISNSSSKNLSLEVAPIKINKSEPLLLILFTEHEKPETFESHPKGAKQSASQKDRKIKKLEEELLAMRLDLRSITEEQESANEELQSANEEIASTNEEFQSVNEELETSKEEIESTNEELITTNQELQTRNELLIESESFSEAILSTIHEPMLILDKELRVKSTNKSFCEKFDICHISGLKRAEKACFRCERTISSKRADSWTLSNVDSAAGIPLYELGNKQWDIPQLLKMIEAVNTKRKSFENFEVKASFDEKGEKGEKTMLINGRHIVQTLHNENLTLLAFNDITEHNLNLIKEKEKEQLKKSIQEVKEHNTALEKAVRERTKQIEQASQILENKNKELENINEKLTAFNYVSSHDLQEPLRKIQLFAMHILENEEQNLSEKGKDYFDRMRQAALRMQTLIEDLLSYSRADNKKVKREITDINDIAKDVIEEFKEELKEKNAETDIHKRPILKVVRFQFHQLLHNLVGNAVKFSDPKKTLHITIKSEISKGEKLNNKNLQPHKKYFHISLSDNGIGFDPKYNDRIFEVFQRLHGKDEYKGTGIGLAICKKIVENHQGIITASGKINKGAVFNIYMPVDSAG